MFKVLHLLLLIPIMFFICFGQNSTNSGMFTSMHRAVIKFRNKLNMEKRKTENQKVCYPEIGCFSAFGPLKHLAILPEPPNVIETKFYAFSEESASTPHLLDITNRRTLKVVNVAKHCVFIIHGFQESHSNPKLIELKNVLLNSTDGKVGTVIMVDWEKGANVNSLVVPNFVLDLASSLFSHPQARNMLEDYDIAAANSELVGRQIAVLANWLKTLLQMSPANFHLIGFSLGAQVAGFAGKWSRAQFHWSFGRISGLDAAAPLFESFSGSFLTKDDADFVDGIHTSVGTNILLGEVGFAAPYGHVDFYPNAGVHQPVCKSILDIACNHQAAVWYFIASIKEHSVCQLFGFVDANLSDAKRYDTVLGFYANEFANATGKRYVFPLEKYPFCKK